MSTFQPVILDMTSPLPEQLVNAPANTTHLKLDTDIPSDADWNLLSSHFTSVTHLFMESGWDERLGDAGIPLHWPLQKLTLSSACGEVCTSPWIVEGRVKHLVFYYTAGLRFEGPKTDELVKAHDEAIAKGEKEAVKAGKLTITYVPDLVQEWMKNKYDNLKTEESETERERKTVSQLRTLEIIYNDAHDTLCRYILANSTLIDPIETLHLDASSPHDLDVAPENLLGEVLVQLTELRTLVLTLGDIYESREQLPSLVRSLPPNLEVLRFRSSVALAAKPELFNEWVNAFGDPKFLPNLKSLSFVLDLEDGEKQRRGYEEAVTAMESRSSIAEAAGGAPKTTDVVTDEAAVQLEAGAADGIAGEVPPDIPKITTEVPEPKVSDEVLTQARRACERLWRAAESRGVVVERFGDSWSKNFDGIKPVDERWEKL